MIVFKPGDRHTEHLQDQGVADHRQALDAVWRFRTASRETNDFVNTMAWWHKMGALDQTEFKRLVEGPFAGKDFKLVAMMTPQAAALMHHYYPDATKDRNEFYRILREHPEWQVKG